MTENASDAHLILAADNESDILALIKFRLERAGCEVVTAKDGERALELMAERAPDLVLLDVAMPKRNGYEVVRQIRASEDLSEIPVIMLSASVTEEDIALSLEAGANHHLQKPFSPRDLVQLVQRLLGETPRGMTGESDSGRPLVLVADDDEDILALVSFRLNRAGYRVLSAPDGEQALELIVGRRPDLAVLDVRMPKLTGIDVIRKVRATKSLSELPMVLLSAGVEDENIASGFDAGADDYMKKPFSPQELLARVESILGRR